LCAQLQLVLGSFKKIRKVQPKGPYNIAGYSFGCTIALEMGLQLEKEDKKLVNNLLFLDGSHKYVSSQTDKYKSNKQITVIGAENEADVMCTFLMQFVSFEYLRVSNDFFLFLTCYVQFWVPFIVLKLSFFYRILYNLTGSRRTHEASNLGSSSRPNSRNYEQSHSTPFNPRTPKCHHVILQEAHNCR
jgi:hypothetical protein